MKHTQIHSKERLRRMAQGEQAECINEAFKKVMTSAYANFIVRITQKELSFPNLPKQPPTTN